MSPNEQVEIIRKINAISPEAAQILEAALSLHAQGEIEWLVYLEKEARAAMHLAKDESDFPEFIDA